MNVLLEHQVMDLLEQYGAPVLPHRFVTTPVEAATAAAELGFPVVMKIVSPDILHKSDVGGVKVGLPDVSAVKAGFTQMMGSVQQARPQAALLGALLYPQAPEGLEFIVGLVQDASFGPVLMFGLGGVFVEALADATFRAVPITQRDALQMIRGIKTQKVLAGWRGNPPVDVEDLAGLLVKVSDLAAAHPEIAEMDLNPVRACPNGALILDARIILKEEAR